MMWRTIVSIPYFFKEEKEIGRTIGLVVRITLRGS
jgi:hypothetical protein